MIVLDTHVWIWWLTKLQPLPAELQEAVEAAANEGSGIGVSVISCWEIGLLVSKDRLDLEMPAGAWIAGSLDRVGVELLELTAEIAVDSCELPGEIHGDPADRIITATAIANNATLLTVDRKLLAYEHVNTVGPR